MRKILFTIMCMLGAVSLSYTQNPRTSIYSTLGWYNVFGTLALNEKWALHAEYQWRRDNLITDWQQSVLKTGVQYTPIKGVQCRLAYAWVETYPYGDIPINAMGKVFTEHRIYESLALGHSVGRFEFSHRYMLEQRFVGRYTDATLTKEDTASFVHRFRYMAKVQMPLKGTSIADKTPYVALYDEVFIGFGEQVQQNVFDQNRLGVLLGYKFNGHFRAEAGYFNQTLQFGRLIDDKQVYQHNNGVIVNLVFNMQLDAAH